MTKENERVKRDLKHAKEIHTGNMKEMEERFTNLQDDCKHETTRLENEVGEIQDNHNSLIEDHRKLENKYKTISKANSAAISDVENLKQENKKLRVQLHDATTSKTSELIDLRNKLDKMSKGKQNFISLCHFVLKEISISLCTLAPPLASRLVNNVLLKLK